MLTPCGQCEGTGRIDSGAPDHYGGFYEIACPECGGTGKTKARGPVRADDPPPDDLIVLAYCHDGQYRTARHTPEGWFRSDSAWQMTSGEQPAYWWTLPTAEEDRS